MRLDLTGSVKNLSNGNVEFYIQGDESKILIFLDRIQRGDGRFIQVEDYQIKEMDPVLNEKGFGYY